MSKVRLAEFEVDLSARRLRRNGTDVPLQEQPFRILELLLSAPDRTMTREQLTATLWPAGTFVDFDRALNTAVNKLRAALGDSAEAPRFIESIGRHAYRLRMPSPKSRRALIATIAASAAAAIGVFLMIALAQRPRLPIRSIAVLPLHNLSKSDDYLADALTDEIITRLAQGTKLQVTSRQSVLRFKRSSMPLPDIARELGVDAIVEGTVAGSGERIRVTTQLLDARNDRHLWAGRYERSVKDMLALQNGIAEDVAEQIGVTLGAPSKAPDNEAYLLYLRGIHEWNKLPPNFGAAIQLFENAIRLDARFARAYAGLADCFATRRWWKTTHAPDDADRARALAETALRLDPSLAEAYTTLAGLSDDAHQHEAAERYFQRAIAANANYIIAHQWYALHLVRLRRYEDALREARIAQRIDPLSPYAINGLLLVLDLSGRFDEVIALRSRYERLFPDLKWSPFEKARQLREAGRASEAVTAVKAGLSASEGAAVDREYQARGADAALRLALRNPQFTGTAWMRARFHALLGEHDAALDELERSLARRDNGIVYAAAAQEFASLRDHPRFRVLISSMNLQ